GPGLRAVPTAKATGNAKAFLDALGIKPGDLGRLETLSAAEIQAAAAKVTPANPMQGFSPCIDGIALPRDPFHPDAPPLSADVPVMIGTNKDEATLFLFSDPKFGDYDEETMQRRVKQAAGERADALLAALRQTFPDYSPSHLAAAAQTAVGMWMGSITLAERKVAQRAAPVYMYLLTWETPAGRGKLRCPHALEIPLMFDNVEAARSFVGR